MATPAHKLPGDADVETGADMGFHVASVSHFWLGRLVEIDAHWNPKSWSVQLFERELSSRSSVVRGLFSGNDLVGYLIAHVVCNEAHIVSFGLAPKWRGIGGGRFLLREFLRSSRLEGITVVTLDVRVTNLRARKLYEESGFEVVGIRRNYYSDNSEDALTMRLDATQPKSGLSVDTQRYV
jgi:ribosomal-protein-alanine N-acetyltransferase